MSMNVVPYTRRGVKRSRPSAVGSCRARVSKSIPRSMKGIQNQVHSAVSGCSQNFTINNTTGFQGTGTNLAVVCCQNQVLYSIGGAPFVPLGGAGTVFPNASSFATIYDTYRITKMDIEIMFSNNSSLMTAAPSLPIVYGVIDYDDITPLTSVQQALGYATCKTMQLGNSSGVNGGKQKITVSKPAVRRSVDTTNVTFGTVASAEISRSPWLNTDVVNVEHNGVKFFMDTVSQSAVFVGAMTLTVRVYQEYKYSK